VACNEVLLADDMGLGKTIQTIAALRVLFVRKQIETALVVCPASIVSQWKREIAKWAPDLRTVCIAGSSRDRSTLWRMPGHIRLVSYDTLRGDVLDLRDSPALRTNWSVVVLDEASRIKNSMTGISIACKRLPRDRRWALTGTPLENRIDDVGSILEFLLNGPEKRSSGVSDPATIRESLRQLQLRRKKEDVLPDLPPKRIIEEFIDLQPKQREAYDHAERDGIVRLKNIGQSITVTHVLELITRLKQICNNDPRSGESAKLTDIENRLETLVAEGHRALIFSQFTDANFGVELAAHRLRAFSPLTYTGAMTASQKDAVIRTFDRDTWHKALVLSLRAGGVGLNLQTASYVFHLDRWWNPAIEDQAESRAHRMGQAFPVTAFRYICSGTIEERIDAKLQAKRRLFKEIVDDVSIDLAAALTEEELFGLFELEPPRKQFLFTSL
jgi:SNF2 family DNA or RNA helicase